MPNEAKISQILGIDFGTAKVGLALADMETRIAFVYATLKNDGNFLAELGKIIEKENVEKIVIGKTMTSGFQNLGGKDGWGGCQELTEKIKEKFPEISVDFQNEMFTTKSAQDNLIEKGMKNVGKFDDAESAKIILQDFLDKAF